MIQSHFYNGQFTASNSRISFSFSYNQTFETFLFHAKRTSVKVAQISLRPIINGCTFLHFVPFFDLIYDLSCFQVEHATFCQIKPEIFITVDGLFIQVLVHLEEVFVALTDLVCFLDMFRWLLHLVICKKSRFRSNSTPCRTLSISISFLTACSKANKLGFRTFKQIRGHKAAR